MDVINELLQGFGLGKRPQPIETASALADFVDQRASFLAQKCVVEFCRVRAGVFWQKLFDEEDFRATLSRSCWESFGPSVAMILEMVDGNLREEAGLRQRLLPGALADLGADVIARYEQPPAVEADYGVRQSAIVAAHMESLKGEPLKLVRDMAKPMSGMVFKLLPIHKDIVKYDKDYIRNNLRMNLVRAHEDFVKIANTQLLVVDLLGPHE